jgi:DNA-binding transcriptional LysR family regulator
MSVLVAAVDAGSLSAAARRLGTPLATVSRKVSALETHLKTRLLNRSSRRLTLTDAGRAYVAACKRILEEVSEAERAATGEYSAPRGELVVTAPIVFGRLHVLPVVMEFLQAYPEVDVRLVLADRVINLLEDHVNLAVRIGELPDSSLVATRIGAIRKVICGSPGYFATRGTPQAPDDLSRHDWVIFEGLMSPDLLTLTTGKSELVVRIHARLVVNTAEAAIDAAVAGIGITRVLSYQVADAVRAGTLVLILEKLEPA